MKPRNPNPVLSPAMTAGIAMVLGGVLALPPMNADANWLSAQKSRDVNIYQRSLQPNFMNPANTNKYLNTIKVFEENSLTSLAHKYALEAIRFNRDNFDSWRILYFLQETTDQQRNEAIENMKRLDPLNPDVTAP